MPLQPQSVQCSASVSYESIDDTASPASPASSSSSHSSSPPLPSSRPASPLFEAAAAARPVSPSPADDSAPLNILHNFSPTSVHDPTCPPPPFIPLSSFRYPEPVGLYHPSLERDACGVGMIAHLKGVASHALVRDGLHILKRMSHRGACGCDEATGDGAGILTAIPHAYFARVVQQQLGKRLPEAGKYAVGNVFLSKDWDERQAVKAHIESLLPAHSIQLICWRPVPVDNQQLGEGSRGSEPCIEQLFLAAPEAMEEEAYATLLFILRKKIDSTYRLPHRLYLCSLSQRVIVYKGQLTPEQLDSYFIDIGQWDFTSHLILVHSRFSTNTFPSWERAQPLRCIAHNGEINTLKGNTNWMLSREGQMQSGKVAETDWPSMLPIIDQNTSDSGAFDNVVELLTRGGQLDIEEAMLMMIPEPWQKHSLMPAEKKDMYEFFSHKLEPWDGPALLCFTDGRRLGASLDRNGLRPGRTYILADDRVILASEVGVLPHIPDSMIRSKGRLTPGEMFLIDFTQQRVVSDEEIKHRLAIRRPYGDWLRKQKVEISALTAAYKRHVSSLKPSQQLQLYASYPSPVTATTLMERLKLFGYTVESISLLVGPMGVEAMEALGSMGNDEALACLSSCPKHVFDYFQQMFAQVTNPPIDPIRESIVMSLATPIGPEGNLLAAAEADCQRIHLDGPVLTYDQFAALSLMGSLPLEQHSPLHHLHSWHVTTLDMTWAKEEGAGGLEPALRRLCDEAEKAIAAKAKIIILTDKGANALRVPLPSLLAVGAVHQHLVKRSLRSQVGLLVEAGDAYEVHHVSLLIGFGVDAILPYMAYEACWKYQADHPVKERLSMAALIANYQKSAHKGVLKVMAKMGISTLQSYKGAQIFEAVGVHADVIKLCFTGCASRIGGSSFPVFAADMLRFHEHAYPPRDEGDAVVNAQVLENPGFYHWRTGVHSESHLNHPDAISKLQEAARLKSRAAYAQYVEISNEMAGLCTLRGQFTLKRSRYPVPLEQVESAKAIVKRFATGAMSYGSISIEAHSTLALAMNRIGGQSNTGEGGEHISRYEPTADGQSTRSAIKQVASGRFGVTIHYLTNSNEIQIKMAQGAKPGEGGELPGHKVVGEIAKTRNSTPGVGLISPPPHHDIYSIEDLAQLIFDLKNSNPSARISVKLVSEVGVGVVASGVAKGKADHILISGHDGGTGASKWTGIKHAGLPWELGLAEAHQTLVLNGLRGRVVLQTDGQLKTGLDIVKAALFGAEEYCFATAPLIAMGCIMMRKCHLNTCPVGIATQDPELRRKFSGHPDHVVTFFFMMAEEVREHMAMLGFRRLSDMVGHVELMEAKVPTSIKTQGLDLSSMLVPAASLNAAAAQTCVEKQDHMLENVLDRKILARIGDRLQTGETVKANHRISNTDRAVGATLSHYLTRAHGLAGLPDNTVHLRFKGSAGQSFGAWLAPGITMELNGDSNDYVGKGLSGGRLIIYPPKESLFKSEDNVIVGNVCLYGATAGSAFFRGRALQRFAVRNSGCNAVVEGVGDHGCEYMTGGIVVILGSTGRNFAAGMSGGIAYVYNPSGSLADCINRGLVQMEALDEREDSPVLEQLIDQHRLYTGSSIADRILWNWEDSRRLFVKVIPTDYKAILDAEKKLKQQQQLQQKESSEAVKAKAGIGAGGIVSTGNTAQPTAANKPEQTSPFDLEAKARQAPAPGCGKCTCGAAGDCSSGSAAASGGSALEKAKAATGDQAQAATYEQLYGKGGEEKEREEQKELPIMDASAFDIEELHKKGCQLYVPPRPVSVPKPNKKRGFIDYERGAIAYRETLQRVMDFKEIYSDPIQAQLKTQASRCMDCLVSGTPITVGCGWSLPIEALTSAGQRLHSFDLQSHGLVLDTLVAAADKGLRAVVRLSLADGRFIECTPEHEVLVRRHRPAPLQPELVYVKARDVRVGPVHALQEVGSRIGVKRNRLLGGLDAAAARSDDLVMGPDTVLIDVSRADASDAAWTLPLGDLTVADVRFDTAAARLRALAFTRVVGFMLGKGWISRNARNELVGCVLFAQALDRDEFLRAVSVVTGGESCGCLWTSQQRGRMLVKRWHLTLPASLTRALAGLPGMPLGDCRPLQLASWPSFVFDAATPLTVVRELLAAYMGAAGHAANFAKAEQRQLASIRLQRSTSAHHCASMDALFAQISAAFVRIGLPAQSLLVKTVRADSETGSSVHSLLFRDSLAFMQHVGFRFSVAKQAKSSVLASLCRFHRHVGHQRVASSRLSQSELKGHLAVRLGVKREIEGEVVMPILHRQLQLTYEQFSGKVDAPLSKAALLNSVGAQIADEGELDHCGEAVVKPVKVARCDVQRADDSHVQSQQQLASQAVKEFFAAVGASQLLDVSAGLSSSQQHIPCYFLPAVSLAAAPTATQRVFDLSVHDNPSFVANSVVVHNCGIPFCHDSKGGCPLGNKIPEWNDLVYRGQWKDALERLLETNNFPEFTGRACPAPCEGACVLGINEKAVTIKNIEVSIIDRAWKEGWIVPKPPKQRSGKRVSVVGSGPAGLAVADQLNRAGHRVVVFERADRVGGLLMYGVPNMKLDKKGVVDRRVDIMRAEGVDFRVNVDVGGAAGSVSAQKLLKDTDVLVLATGATRPRDLNIPGRELRGIEYAMDFLTANTKSLLDSSLQDGKFINAKGKRVLVIGGGDTGNDCIGTSVRHGAKSVVNFELLPIPSRHRAENNPWPQWPRIFRVDYGHEEVKAVHGSDPRQFSVLTKRFIDDGKGNVKGVDTIRIRWEKDEEARWQMTEIAGTEKTYACDLVLLAMGFTGPETALSDELKLDCDERGNYRAQFGKYRTNVERVWTCGDCRRGQSLIVWAIAEGRQCAREVDRYLMGSTILP